jgi:hypothetical protein
MMPSRNPSFALRFPPFALHGARAFSLEFTDASPRIVRRQRTHFTHNSHALNYLKHYV